MYSTYLMISMWYTQAIFSHLITILLWPMDFSKYIASMNDSCWIKGWIFTAWVRGRFRHLSKGAFVNDMKKFCRGLLFVSYGSNGKMNYESKAEPRNFFFSCIFLLSFSLNVLFNCSSVVSKFLRLSL